VIAGCGQSDCEPVVAVIVVCAGGFEIVEDCVLGELVAMEGEAGFGHFGEQACGQLDGGEKRVGYGALDAIFGKRLGDLVDGDEEGRLVEEGREDKRRGGIGFGLSGKALGVVVAAISGAVDGGCGASLAVVEGLKAFGRHGSP
jgi:hypothetical protein